MPGTKFKEIMLTVRFLTPAFLGDAEQNGRWRTPPFKALLRQWWRVVYAARHNFQVNLSDLRRTEGKLFGNAWLTKRNANGQEESDFSKSQVRMRLERWDPGQLENWQGLEQKTVFHPEVQRTNYQVGPHAYLGYGPLDGRGGTKLLRKNVVNAGEKAELLLAFPENEAVLIEQALYLMHLFGAAGGRSRNGWGSFVLEGYDWPDNLPSLPLRDWKNALNLDWPHAIGKEDDGPPLIWQTAGSYADWKSLMRDLAIIKIGLRTQFVFQPVAVPARLWLAYPVTNHTRTWGKTLRLPNSLRFKVRPAPDDPSKLVGVIFHVPCSPPAGFGPNLTAISDVWKDVHSLLNEMINEPNKRNYISIKNAARKAALKPHLDKIMLKRIPR